MVLLWFRNDWLYWSIRFFMMNCWPWIISVQDLLIINFSSWCTSGLVVLVVAWVWLITISQLCYLFMPLLYPLYLFPHLVVDEHDWLEAFRIAHCLCISALFFRWGWVNNQLEKDDLILILFSGISVVGFVISNDSTLVNLHFFLIGFSWGLNPL